MKQWRVLTLVLMLGGAWVSYFSQDVVCNGKAMRLDPAKTILKYSTDRKLSNYILNGAALNFRHPDYPEEARQKHIGGAVIVMLTVSERGKVVSAKAVSGPPLLRPISVDAVRKTKFKRLLFDCRPAKYAGTFGINFAP